MGDDDPPPPLASKHDAVAQLLQDAASLSTDMCEAQVMSDQVRRRLEAIANALAALREHASSDSNDTTRSATRLEDLHKQLALLVTQFHAFIVMNAGKSHVYRLASSRVVVAHCRACHAAIDDLLATAERLLPSAVATRLFQHDVHSWTDRFDNARVNMQLELDALSRDRMRLLRDMRDLQAQQEALTLIVYEHKRRAIDGSTATDKERQTIQHAFNTVARISRAKVPVLPSWFLALYDIDTIVTAPLEGLDSSASRVVRAAHIGMRSGAAVCVTFIRPEAAQLEAFRRDVAAWCSLAPHPHVVRVHGASHIHEPFLVTDDISDASVLQQFVTTAQLQKNDVWRLLGDAAKGLEALHMQNVIHRALVRNSLLVTSDGSVHIADGIVTILVAELLDSAAADTANDANDKVERDVNEDDAVDAGDTQAWLAPELLRRTDGSDVSVTATTASDVYAFGLCVLDVVMSSLSIHDKRTVVEIVHDTTTKPIELTTEQWTFVQHMCANRPENRPGIADVVATLEGIATRKAMDVKEHDDDVGNDCVTVYEAPPEEITVKATAVAVSIEDTTANARAGRRTVRTSRTARAARSASAADKQRVKEDKKRAKEEKKRIENERKESRKRAKLEERARTRQKGGKMGCVVM